MYALLVRRDPSAVAGPLQDAALQADVGRAAVLPRGEPLCVSVSVSISPDTDLSL